MGLERTAPVLPTLNVRAALARYQRLGFRTWAYLEPGMSEPEAPIWR